MNLNMKKRIADIQTKNEFSGTILVQENKEILAEVSHGYANRSEQLQNHARTRYGIASGCKLFTAIAICQLVEERKLSFDSKLKDCLDVNFPNFDKEINIHHLLTHTSGIPDYFDEETMDDFEELWVETPMYRVRALKDFLPLFQDKPMKFKAGERFHYNNAGYILLGLIVEQASRLSFAEYVQEHIFRKAGMADSGYFEFDALPPNTAQGYIDFKDGTWKTNIYSLPAKGGSDGGAFVTVHDMVKLWEAIMNHLLLNEAYTRQLLTSHARVDENHNFYGYGVWIKKNENGSVLKYHVMGYDPGVNFHSAFYPEQSVNVVICSNKSTGAFDMMIGIEDEMNRP
ncbi:serine hydrolase domain-containing protein [Paenibacillus sp. DMB20]|uniref:serine hydrolase domain-containing protein n=1 Tax=Paenibacillus sp. DMB20 TaxID=1642570 RepID=UPI000628299A|nr:serine hydrolase [Paenibacillus sp. DMB20]KKO55241.1 penicillin-binding protein [Paenibacillus sp. DMB20]